MRIVLSRKGFDSAAGRVASPIFPDGRMLSLPIPHLASPITYADISFADQSVGQIVSDLTRNQVDASTKAHLDPDLRASAVARKKGWRPLFGQDSAAQSHLATMDVRAGDLFLFFGWFRRVHLVSGSWKYVPRAPDLHVLFGWLEVGEVVPIANDWPAKPAWAVNHPHFHGNSAKNNTLYVSREPGKGSLAAGPFETFDAELQLSAGDRGRSRWRLPAWFNPQGRASTLSYHSGPRWEPNEEGVIVNTVGRGQEFVLNGADYPEAEPWARGLIQRHGAKE